MHNFTLSDREINMSRIIGSPKMFETTTMESVKATSCQNCTHNSSNQAANNTGQILNNKSLNN